MQLFDPLKTTGGTYNNQQSMHRCNVLIGKTSQCYDVNALIGINIYILYMI